MLLGKEGHFQESQIIGVCFHQSCWNFPSYFNGNWSKPRKIPPHSEGEHHQTILVIRARQTRLVLMLAFFPLWICSGDPFLLTFMNKADLNQVKIRPLSTRMSSPSLTPLPSHPPRCHLTFPTPQHFSHQRGSGSIPGQRLRGKAKPYLKTPLGFVLLFFKSVTTTIRCVLFLCLMRRNFPTENALKPERRPAEQPHGLPHRNAEAAISWSAPASRLGA